MSALRDLMMHTDGNDFGVSKENVALLSLLSRLTQCGTSDGNVNHSSWMLQCCHRIQSVSHQLTITNTSRWRGLKTTARKNQQHGVRL